MQSSPPAPPVDIEPIPERSPTSPQGLHTHQESHHPNPSQRAHHSPPAYPPPSQPRERQSSLTAHAAPAPTSASHHPLGRHGPLRYPKHQLDDFTFMSIADFSAQVAVYAHHALKDPVSTNASPIVHDRGNVLVPSSSPLVPAHADATAQEEKASAIQLHDRISRRSHLHNDNSKSFAFLTSLFSLTMLRCSSCELRETHAFNYRHRA